MSLPHALLTSLLERPSSGSELASRFDRSIGYFWNASHQQIYRELARLEEAGWVKSEADEGARGRKRSYRVLPAGKKELKRWVSEQSVVKPLRDELMVRLRAEAVVGPGTQLAHNIEAHLAQHREQLAEYEAIEVRDFSGKKGKPVTREARLQHLLLSTGIMYERMYIELAEQALRILNNP